MGQAAILTRVSYGDAKTVSPEHQEQDCRKKATELGMSVVYVGTEVNRKRDAMETSVELARIRQMMYRRQIQALIVRSYDRIGCNDEEFNLFWYEARMCEVQIISCTEPAYEDTPEGAFKRHMDTYFRARELATTRARLAWGMEKRVAAGKMWPNWRAPYGLAWADEGKTSLVVNGETVNDVLRIYQDIADGVSAKQLGRNLTSEGILSPTGKDHWGADTVCDIIHNPVYRGISVIRRRAVPSRVVFDEAKGIHVRKRNRDTDYEMVMLPEGTAPRVVSDELWQRAEAALSSAFLGQRRGNLDGKFLLRGGFAVCSECGSALRPAYGRNHQLIYACRSNGSMLCKTGASVRVTQEYLDIAVWSDIIDICAQPGLAESRLEEMQQQFSSPSDVQVKDMRTELDDMVAQQERLLDAIQTSDDKAFRDTVTERLHAVSIARHKQEELIKTAEAKMSTWSGIKKRYSDTIEACRQLTAQTTISYHDQRSLLQQLAVFVTVYPKRKRTDTSRYHLAFFAPDGTYPQPSSVLASRKSFSTGMTHMWKSHLRLFEWREGDVFLCRAV